MQKQKHLIFIGVLIIIGSFVIVLAGGFELWKRKIKLGPIPISKTSTTGIPGSRQQDGIIEVNLDQEFTLKKNQLAKIVNTQMTLFALSIVYEPCPTGVKCIWAGPVYTNLDVKHGVSSKTISLGRVTAMNNRKKQDVFGFTISLLDISSDEIRLKIEPSENAIDQCLKLEDRECRENLNCIGVYGPSCPSCMDIVFQKCRKRLHGKTNHY